ncbi:MAG: hypothetical protein IPM47_12010 [Sphingobacteriales bacterium]|nr:MAG: hypothetical protein IPM47_12010 [Sphingobacteriales bacterium]
MKYLTFVLFLFSIVNTSAQSDKKGIVKTANGFLFYFNNGINSHTLELEGEVDFRNFPSLKENGVWFEFHRALKEDFGSEEKSILSNYMNWEAEYLKQELNLTIVPISELLIQNNIPINIWKYKSPFTNLPDDIVTPIKATYFLDFVQNDLIYRFSYASISGSDTQAKEILLRLFNKIRFYKNGIDLEKLQQNIQKGINYY